MRPTSLIFGLTAVIALSLGSPAFAQRGGHGGGHPGGARPAGVHTGGAHPGGVYGGYPGGYRGYYGGYPYYHHDGHYGYGSYLAGGLFLGLALGSALSDGPGYYYGGPAYPYYTVPGYEVAPALPPPPGTLPPPAPALSPQGVILNVVVPKADAQVMLGDTVTASTGTERLFQSPPLEPGKSYQYTVKARWLENGKVVEQTRSVPVRAGQQLTVDFRTPAKEAVGPPIEK